MVLLGIVGQNGCQTHPPPTPPPTKNSFPCMPIINLLQAFGYNYIVSDRLNRDKKGCQKQPRHVGKFIEIFGKFMNRFYLVCTSKSGHIQKV